MNIDDDFTKAAARRRGRNTRRVRNIGVAACVSLLAAMAVRSTPATAASARTWSVQPSPSPSGRDGYLYAVACPSSMRCVAVGYSNDANFGYRLLEVWNGSTWTTVTTPGPAHYTTFSGVTCVGPNFCTAVGAGPNGPLVDHWNGSQWSTQTAPGKPLYAFQSISCPSTTECFAVGSTDDEQHALAERWDGHTWSALSTPATTEFGDSLRSVSCVSTTYCIAVGETEVSDVGDATQLIEQWNGTKWSGLTAAVLARDTVLDGISCTSATNCFATGYSFDGVGSAPNSRRHLEHWDGHSWSIVVTPGPAGTRTAFLGITCSNPTNCIAVGSSNDDPMHSLNPKPLIDAWNGHSWVMQTAAPSPTGIGELDGIGCAATACVAVGSAFAPTARQERTLIERS